MCETRTVSQAQYQNRYEQTQFDQERIMQAMQVQAAMTCRERGWHHAELLVPSSRPSDILLKPSSHVMPSSHPPNILLMPSLWLPPPLLFNSDSTCLVAHSCSFAHALVLSCTHLLLLRETKQTCAPLLCTPLLTSSNVACICTPPVHHSSVLLQYASLPAGAAAAAPATDEDAIRQEWHRCDTTGGGGCRRVRKEMNGET